MLIAVQQHVILLACDCALRQCCVVAAACKGVKPFSGVKGTQD